MLINDKKFLDETTCRIIRECKKFSNKAGSFVDIGAGSDLYYEFLSPYFNKIYCVEEDSDLIEKIKSNIMESSLCNVEVVSISSTIDNIVFLRISKCLTESFDFLKIKNYPPFIFSCYEHFETNKKHLEKIGYAVSYLVDGIYLASSNALFESREIKHLDIESLIKHMSS